MAQGKEFTKEQREVIIESLKPYLEMGFSRNKACDFIGLDPSTLSRWATDDESLSMRLTSYENVITTIALNNIGDAIKKEAENKDDIKKENSWKWGERRLKELAPKQETDITTNGKDIPTPILNVLSDNSNE